MPIKLFVKLILKDVPTEIVIPETIGDPLNVPEMS